MIPIELEGAMWRQTLDLADDVPVGHLLPTMVTLVGEAAPGSGRWTVTDASGRRLDPRNTPVELGIEPGDRLYIARLVPATEPGLPMARIGEASRPSIRTDAALPPRLRRTERWRAVMVAFTGLSTVASSVEGSAVARARDTWRWTDRRLRLSWLIGRPRLTQTVAIGVVACGGDGAAVAVELAAVLAEHREDRVMLVDGVPTRAGVSSLVSRHHPTVAGVASGPDAVDPRFGRHHVVRIDPGDPGSPPAEYRTHLERVRRQAGLLVIDCGALGRAPLADLCEQVVLVGAGDLTVGRSMGARRPVVVVVTSARTVAAVDRVLPTAAGVVANDRDGWSLELAALLAAGWRS